MSTATRRAEGCSPALTTCEPEQLDVSDLPGLQQVIHVSAEALPCKTLDGEARLPEFA